MKRKKISKKNFKLTPTSIKNYVITTLIALILGCTFWSQTAVTAVRTPQPGGITELYANQVHDDLILAYTNVIDKAEHSILLVVYSLTDPKIIASLRNKSEEGISVKVICDAKASPYIDTKLGSKIETIRRFGPGLMHQKILVIDNKQTWIGSANMTTESLNMHGNLIAAMESESLAAEVMKKANTLKTEGKDESFPYTIFLIGGQEIELWFLPDNKGAVNRIKELIRTAKKTMRIAMFTWTRQDLAHEVIAAAKRGVKTEVVIDHYTGKGASSKIVTLLKRNGISINLSRGGPLLHHKFLYIDSSTLVNGSANWTKAAFTQNDDCFIVMHNLTREQRERMDAVWNAVSSASMPP